MSPLTIAGLPVLAIIDDFRADATGNARRRAEKLRPPPIGRLPGKTGRAARPIDGQRE